MLIKQITKLTLFICCLFSGLIFAQDELNPWEKLGLSKTEWRLINENNIKMSKVEELLKAGISIGEYIQKPWLPLNLSESSWINKRRSGMTSYDIELENQPSDTNWKKDYNNDAGKDLRHMRGNGEKFSSLFLPGRYQFRNDHKLKGTSMVGLAGGSILWCTIGSIASKKFDAIPICVLLIPDMIWSFVDYKIEKRNEQRSKE